MVISISFPYYEKSILNKIYLYFLCIYHSELMDWFYVSTWCPLFKYWSNSLQISSKFLYFRKIYSLSCFRFLIKINVPSGYSFFNEAPLRTKFVVVFVQDLELFIGPFSKKYWRILEICPSLTYLKLRTIETFFFKNLWNFFPLLWRKSWI